MVLRSFTIASMLLATLPCSTAALAQQQDPRAAQAHKDCLAGKPESGVAMLAELYVETKDPNFVYNQARCFEQNGRFADAVSRFREYLRVAKDLGDEDKVEVQRHIAECRQLEAEQEGTAPTPTAPPSAPIPPLAPAPPVADAVPARPPALALTTTPNPVGPSDQSPPYYKTWWFWTGAAAIVAASTITILLVAGAPNGPCDGATNACRGVK